MIMNKWNELLGALDKVYGHDGESFFYVQAYQAIL